MLTEDHFEELNDTLKDVAYGLSEIGRGVGNPEYIDGPESLTEAVDRVATSLKCLGNGDAVTPMGALEAHGKAILDAADKLSMSLNRIADAIRSLRP